jgi:hypothetical protein
VWLPDWYNCCFFLNFVPLHIESPYNFGGTGPILGVKKTSAEGKWACCSVPHIDRVVSKSVNPGPVPNSYFLYYIFIKALILIKYEHNA